ncbi:MAG: T9SS type A sorting domain-containing protein, partial [Crocinitomicaceae bacterium]|nr:T9SS type A sorting domain-containing protein [Crocinitomicaceae bacterium]
WSGNELCDRETIIGFNYSSFDHFPGTATIYYGNDGNYSAVKTISKGLNYVDRLPTSMERWGDYFGLQRIYNQEGTVGSFGYWATETRGNSGYYATLFSPDTTQLQAEVNFQKNAPCDWHIDLTVINAEQPVQFDWHENNNFVTDNKFGPVCAGDTINVMVLDERGCEKQLQIIVPLSDLNEGINVYPNPVIDFVAVQFELKNDSFIKAELYDMAGNKVHVLTQMQAKKGLNEFSFSAINLAQGVYNLVISSEKEIIDTFKIVKQ